MSYPSFSDEDYVLAMLLRQGRYADEVMGILKAERNSGEN